MCKVFLKGKINEYYIIKVLYNHVFVIVHCSYAFTIIFSIMKFSYNSILLLNTLHTFRSINNSNNDTLPMDH